MLNYRVKLANKKIGRIVIQELSKDPQVKLAFLELTKIALRQQIVGV